MQRVRCPRYGSEVPEGRAALRRALKAEGVRPGEYFWVTRDEPVDLSGPGAARTDDPKTAREAALNPSLDRAESRQRVLRALCDLGDATSTEIAEHLGIDRSLVSPRLTELGPGSKAVRYDPPLARKTGRTRMSEMGVENETWEPTERGVQTLQIERGVQTLQYLRASAGADGPSFTVNRYGSTFTATPEQIERGEMTRHPPPETIDEGAAPSIFETR